LGQSADGLDWTDGQLGAESFQMTLGAHNDMVQRWKRRRSYTDAGIRQIQNATGGDILHEEVDLLVGFLAELQGPADVRHDVTLAAARVMYRVAYGRRPDRAAVDALRHMVHTLPDFTTIVGSLSWLDLVPLWRLLRRSALAKFRTFNRFMAAFCRREKQRSLDEATVRLSVSVFASVTLARTTASCRRQKLTISVINCLFNRFMAAFCRREKQRSLDEATVLKTQVLENASTEKASTKQRISQGWKTHVRKMQVRCKLSVR